MESPDLNDKEKALLKIFEDQADISMKDANIILRKEFDTGASGATFSKVKKLFQESGATTENKSEEKTQEKEDSESEEKPEAKSGKKNEKGKREHHDRHVDSKDRPRRSYTDEHQSMYYSKEEMDTVFGVDVEEAGEKDCKNVEIDVFIKSAESVHLSGSFNHWKCDEYELKRVEGDRWVFSGDLPSGEHFFKYVIDGKKWFLDLDREIFSDPTGVSHKITVE